MNPRRFTGTTLGTYAATLALMGAASFTAARAFVDLAPLSEFLIVSGVAALVMAVGRLLGVSPGLCFTAAQPIGIITIAVVFELPHRVYGIVPTPSTLTAVRTEMTSSFATFLDAVPPVPASLGFAVPLAVVLWFATSFGVFAAVEANSPLHATAAPLALFVATSVLLRGTQAIAATIAMCGAVAVLRVATVAARTERHALGGAASTDRAARSVWAAAIPTLGIAAVLGGVATLVVPSTGAGFVDLRELGRKDPPRTVESPLVSVSSLLRGSDDVVLFRVRAQNPHYWRLTSLDRFDGRSWSSNSAYAKVTGGDRLRSTAPVGGNPVEAVHEFELESAFSDWVPTAYQPIEVIADTKVQFDPESSSVFLPDNAGDRELRSYAVRSLVPVFDRTALVRAPTGFDSALAPLDPVDLSPVAIDLAQLLAGDLPPPEAALALESFFHDESFTYDTDANYSASADPLGDFLNERVGFCQQYATAFAAMARVLGIPSRVAVGFVPGEAVPLEGGRFEFTVSSLDGHAWPELYFEGLGWMPFEPTPGRNNPDAIGYSTAGPAASPNQQATTTAPVTTAVPAPDAVPPVPSTTVAAAAVPSPSSDGATTGSATRWRIAIVVAAALGSLTLGWRLARTRRAQQHRADVRRPIPERVASAWEQALIDLRRIDVVCRPSETPLEFGERATEELAHTPGFDQIDLRPLADCEARRRYSAEPLTRDDATLADGVARRLHAAVWAHLDNRSRAKALLSGN
ncbi:MAG: DUF3488 domain-containing transglutaminase family protein [Actinobacteria bacterium]|nr:DUF3488 domain-containing transglutaminase family protein [Actinomycetota bacterium]